MTDFKERVLAVSKRVAQIQTTVSTEEATKHALVLPLLQALGYDVFDPQEVFPEYTADVGTKKGEKIDYAIMRGGIPVILIECKAVGADLDMKHGSQLFRYFSTLKTRLAMLTNGVIYQLFSDIERANVMDTKPFLEVNLMDLHDDAIANLAKISKEAFDIDGVVSVATDLLQVKQIKSYLNDQFNDPDIDFVRLLAGKVTTKNLTQKVLESYKLLAKQAVQGMLNERLNERLRLAMAPESVRATTEHGKPEDGGAPIEHAEDEEQSKEMSNEELMGYFAIKSMLVGIVDLARVHYRNGKSYCAILLDDNNRRPVCRLILHGRHWHVGLFDAQKQITKFAIENIDGLYAHAAVIRARVEAMLRDGSAAEVAVSAGDAQQ